MITAYLILVFDRSDGTPRLSHAYFSASGPEAQTRFGWRTCGYASALSATGDSYEEACDKMRWAVDHNPAFTWLKPYLLTEQAKHG